MPSSGSREHRCASPGFTLIELIVVVCIVALCAALLLDRLRFYQEAAEKAVMEYTVATLKSALQLRVAALLVRGEEKKNRRARPRQPGGLVDGAPGGLPWRVPRAATRRAAGKLVF